MGKERREGDVGKERREILSHCVSGRGQTQDARPLTATARAPSDSASDGGCIKLIRRILLSPSEREPSPDLRGPHRVPDGSGRRTQPGRRPQKTRPNLSGMWNLIRLQSG